MPDIISSIKSDFAHAVIAKCEEKGCTLRLDRLGNYVALKGESVTPQKQICDCIIFKLNGQIIVGVVELKRKNPDTSEVIGQLNKGKALALDILEKCNANLTNTKFCFIILTNSWDPSQLRKIEKERIEVRGKKHRIIRRKCGTFFYDVI